MKPASAIRRIISSTLSIIAAVALLSGATAKTSYAQQAPPEYAVKAAYIYNILRFVDWRTDPELMRHDDINVCVLGKNIFNQYLDPIEEKEIEGRPLHVMQITRVQQTLDCHLVFVSEIQAYPPDEISNLIGNKKIIVVGDNLQFVKDGGMFSFFIENNKVRLAINSNSLEKSGIKVSSLLLEVCVDYGGNQ